MRDKPILAARMIADIDWRGVPLPLKGRVSAVCRSEQDCEDLVKWFGDPTFCPFKPVLLLVPGAPAPLLILGDGYAPAAELRDVAVATWARGSEKIKRTGALMNFDELRERHGLMRGEDFDSALRDAYQRRIKQHRANPVTDPFRVPDYPKVRGKTVHAVAKIEGK